jgi:uncharacterized membrane protein YbhN (UPF0104 family)
MSEAVAAPPPGGFLRRIRWKRIVVIAGVVAVLWVAVDLLGWDVRAWFRQVWDTMTSISLGYLIAGLSLQTVQTTFTAIAWLTILRYAYPDVELPFKPVLAAYATGVALNGWLPANIGTFVTLFMFMAIIPGSTFAGVFAGFLVQKIFFTVVGTFVYLYLFLTVSGSFHREFGDATDHPGLVVLIVVLGTLLIVVLARVFWAKVKAMWEKAKVGGRVLSYPRAYFGKVALPEFIGWCAKLGVTGVFLAAYGIPVTFHTIMSVIGSNSLANTVSVTPGAVGITQAANTAALSDETSAATATAYSLGQQLIVTTWNQVFAIAMLVWAFGWTGGKQLVRTSYGEAKQKADEQKQARADKKVAKQAAGKNGEPAEEA